MLKTYGLTHTGWVREACEAGPLEDEITMSHARNLAIYYGLLRRGDRKWPGLFKGWSPGHAYSGKKTEKRKGDRGTEVR
jgi:hypothetical protein